jgi:hypothetical protein
MALALAAGVALAGCSVSVGSVQHRTTSFTAGSIRALVVNGQVGSIRITGSDNREVRVTEHISFEHQAPGATHRIAAGTLTLYAGCPLLETCSVSYDITVPKAISVRLSAGVGDVWLGSLTGDVTVHTNVGNIDLQALSGPVDVSNHAGSVSGQDLSSASAVINVSAGDVGVTFTAAPASVTATATVGSVTLTVPGNLSYSVSATATVGSVRIGVISNPHSSHVIKASTTTGSISIAPGPREAGTPG